MKLCADLRDVVSEVLTQVPRLLALQDRDPDSPMRGCMHPAYWRDKSSDVADMRRQEAALALAWVWKHPFPGNRWQEDRNVLHAALRAIGFWTRQQHKDGTFDEWYKNEHGYATTAFSSYAMSLAMEALGEELAGPLREATYRALRRAGDWLRTHDDWFKTNHQAVGVAALGAIGHLTGDARYLEAAARNTARIVERMHVEGWSKEISGLDVGYTFLLSEYLAMHAVLTGDTRFLPDIKRAYRFAAEFLHPDLTTGAEYGICGNPYFSRVAAVALAPHDGIATSVVRWMDREVDGPRDVTATLKDDLRLARYAYQPLLAALLQSGTFERRDLVGSSAPVDAEPLLIEREQDAQWFEGARLLAVARPSYVAWVAPCHGGLVRVAFRDGDGFTAPVVDRGYALDAGRATYRNARYSLEGKAAFDGETLTCDAPLTKTGFVMPPYWARVGLRAATALPMGHRWTRWAIDKWRARKGTALNQSAAGVAAGKSPWKLTRTVRLHDDHIEIEDTFAFERVAPQHRFWLVLDGPVQLEDGTRPDVDRRIAASAFGVEPERQGVTIVKRLRMRDGSVVCAGT